MAETESKFAMHVMRRRGRFGNIRVNVGVGALAMSKQPARDKTEDLKDQGTRTHMDTTGTNLLLPLPTELTQRAISLRSALDSCEFYSASHTD